MEHLIYSLWFTFIWWILMMMFLGDMATLRAKKNVPADTLFIFFVVIPSATILLEYLIVR